MRTIQRFSSRIGGVLLHPKETFEIFVHERRGFSEPFIVFLCIVIVEGLLMGVILLGVIREILSIFPAPLPKFILYFVNVLPVFILAGFVVYKLVYFIVWALIAHLSAKHLFNGVGEFEPVLSLFMYSVLPEVIFIFGLVVAVFAPIHGLIFSVALRVAALIWTALLVVNAISQVHGLDMGKSLVSAILIPLVVALIFFPGLLFSRFLFIPLWRFPWFA